MTDKKSYLTIQHNPLEVTNLFHIHKNEIECIKNFRHISNSEKDPPWKFAFDLVTVSRTFTLFALNRDERNLWVNGFKRILGV